MGFEYELTDREQYIVDKAAEKALLALPEAWASLSLNDKGLDKKNSQFYRDYPEFKGQEKSVVSVLAEIDGKHPFIPYEEKLKKAVPEIRKRISQISGLNVSDVNPTPDSFQNIAPPKISKGNGEI